MPASILDLPVEILGRIFTIGCEMSVPTDSIELSSPHPFANRFNFRGKRRMKGFTLVSALVCHKWNQVVRFEGYRHLWISRLRISEWDGVTIETEFWQYLQDLKQVDGEDLDIYWGMACNERTVHGEVVMRIFLHAMNMTLPYRHSIRRLVAVLESPIALRCMLSFISDSPPAKSLMWFGIGSFWLGSTFTFPEDEEDGTLHHPDGEGSTTVGIPLDRKVSNEVLSVYDFKSTSIRCDFTHVMHSLGHVGIYDVAVHQIILPQALTSLDLKRMCTQRVPMDWFILEGLLSQCYGLTKLDLDLFHTVNFPSYEPIHPRDAVHKLRLLSICARIQDCSAILMWFPFPDLKEFLFQHIVEEDASLQVANNPGFTYKHLTTLVVRRTIGYEIEWLSTWTLPSLESLRLVPEVFGFGQYQEHTPKTLFGAPKILEIDGGHDEYVLRLLSYLETERVQKLTISPHLSPLCRNESLVSVFYFPKLEHLILPNFNAQFLFEENLKIPRDTLRTLHLAPAVWDPWNLPVMTHLQNISGRLEELRVLLVRPIAPQAKNPFAFFRDVEKVTVLVDVRCHGSCVIPWFVPGKYVPAVDASWYYQVLEQVPLENLRVLRFEVNLEMKSSLPGKFELLKNAHIWLDRIVDSRRERGLKELDEAGVDVKWGKTACWSQ